MKPSLKDRNWQRAGCVLPETGLNDSCTPACFQTRCVWPNPDQANQLGSRLVLHKMIHASFFLTNRAEKFNPAYTIRPDSGCMLAVMAVTGHNQNASESDPACLLDCLGGGLHRSDSYSLRDVTMYRVDFYGYLVRGESPFTL